MKKTILIFCAVIITVSLGAYGFKTLGKIGVDQDKASLRTITVTDEKLAGNNNNANPFFFYDIGTRFGGVKKEVLDKAISIADFLPKGQTERAVSYKSVDVIILDDSRQTDARETGKDDVLTAGQVKLLKEAGYSANILIRADYMEKIDETGKLAARSITPHLTIVPEIQAEYISGKHALIEYLIENSKKETATVKGSKLDAGKLYFLVTKEGTISNVTLKASSGYSSIDNKMIELITNAPGKWKPAEDSKGVKVDQKLVFSFGIMGC